MALIKSISGIRGTIGGKVDENLTPLDVVKAQKADLVLWNGLNLERWFEKFYGAVKDVPSEATAQSKPYWWSEIASM